MRASHDSADRRERWRARQPEKCQAHRAVEYFVRRLRRRGLPLPNCESCGRTEAEAKDVGQTIQAHHVDYAKPLDVVWLCASCHVRGHWSSSWRQERNGKAVVRLAAETSVA